MANRLRIGLTGGIASGKSTAAGRFIELGVPVIDADEAARAVVAPGSTGLQQVTSRFGPAVLRPDGSLDRAALRTLVFNEPDSRRALEAILHPLIRTHMEEAAARASGPYLVIAIPLLVESNARAPVNRILVIDVDEQTQLARVAARDGGSLDQARSILAAQATRKDRLAVADDVLDNTGSVTSLRHGIDQLHQRYLGLAETYASQLGSST